LDSSKLKQLLVGSWKLVSLESRDANGNIVYPWGKDTLGYLMYNEDGYVSVSIMSSSRPKFSSGDIKGGTAEEKVTAADTYISYCGTYEIKQDMVIHHIELSFFPNWIGVDQKRMLSIDSNRLLLSTPPISVGGIEQTHHLIWERAKNVLER
jgi:hypothetical protein